MNLHLVKRCPDENDAVNRLKTLATRLKDMAPNFAYIAVDKDDGVYGFESPPIWNDNVDLWEPFRDDRAYVRLISPHDLSMIQGQCYKIEPDEE